MMYPRLQLLKDLLAEDGSIWITLDDNEAHYLKVLCDEVFGRKNFISNVIWQKKFSPQNDEKFLTNVHDHVLVYCKDKDSCFFNRLERTEENNKGFSNPDNDSRGVWSSGDLTSKTKAKNHSYPITAPSGAIYYPPNGRQWAPSLDTFNKWLAENRIWFGTDGSNRPRIKQFLSEMNSQGIVPTSILFREVVGDNQEGKREVKVFNQEEIFETPKPEKLIEQIFKIASNENDLILDSFLGSGTTAAVAHKMGRRYIGIEMGEHANTHVIPRLEKVIEGEQGGISQTVNWQGGGGFSFYTLGNPVFDDNGFLNAEVKFKDLASYVWWLETKSALNQTENFDNPFLGIYEGTAYYLLYNGILGDRRPNGGNVLTSSVLNHLNECYAHDGKRIVVGEASRLSPARLEALNIEFKQIPYSLYGNKAK